jgi:hypothetical protein
MGDVTELILSSRQTGILAVRPNLRPREHKKRPMSNAGSDLDASANQIPKNSSHRTSRENQTMENIEVFSACSSEQT